MEIEGGNYRGGRSGDDSYRDDNYPDELYDDDGYRDNYSRGGAQYDDGCGRDAYRPKEPWGNGRSLSGVEIGAILVIAALAGILFYLLISH
ncbi:hypothetical protein FACS1894181_18210 [Bacteroidia bacterium]|nr:hypothetical protein FACS1894181_18210 [Bacteroidia bacterium]